MDKFMDDRELRLACLQLAAHPDKQASQILIEAKRMYDFVMDQKE